MGKKKKKREAIEKIVELICLEAARRDSGDIGFDLYQVLLDVSKVLSWSIKDGGKEPPL